MSSLYSDVFFLSDHTDEELAEVPDYILSDTLQKDLESTVGVCAMGLKKTKYLPESTVVGCQGGALPEGEHEGAVLSDWKDFGITNFEGQPLYDEALLEAAQSAGEPELGAAFWLVVRDICDSGGFLSVDWYRARIVYEYFRKRPTTTDSAYLIGELFKELCVKEAYEGDLSSYFRTLTEAREARARGAKATKDKAEQLRSFCVDLFVDLYKEMGPRLLLAPDETKAEELAQAAFNARPDDF